MAVCDANYRYTMVDIGDAGRQSDGDVFASSHIGYAMNNGLLHLPQSAKIDKTNTILPYVFVGDEAFT